MTTVDETAPTCAECAGPIQHWGGTSYTHVTPVRGRNHPAQPAKPVPVNHATPVSTRVQHQPTGDYGWFLGLDEQGLAEVSFDSDRDSRTDHLPPASLIEVLADRLERGEIR